jgi:hypothetical protein
MEIKKELEGYEKPIVEIVEFAIEESIALSGDSYQGLICNEQMGGSL